MKNNNKGVSIGVVMIVLMTFAMIVGSVMDLTLTGHRTQQDQYIWVDAKNAAEAAVEYGFAELVKRFTNSSAFSTDSLAPSNAPLKLPTQYFTTFGQTGGSWKMSNIELPNQATYDPTNGAQWNTLPTELMGGVIPPGQWKYIDGNTPGNERDPLKNKLVFVRNIKVYGKATAKDFRGRKTTVYASEELQVRDAPLFAHTIFYNMDMELAPSPYMKVTRSVHSNNDIYVSSTNGLDFTGQLTSAGHLYHNTAPGIGKAVDGGAVRFADGSGTLLNMKQSNGSWLDSTKSDWREKSSQIWDGNVQTIAHGIPKLNPVAIDDYVRNDPSTATLDDQLNYGYQLIQPIERTDSSSYNKAIEEQKFSYKAGLTVEVDTTAKTYTLYAYERDVDGNVVYDAGTKLPKKVALNLNLAVSGNDFVKVEGYTYSSGNVTAGMYDKRRAKNVSLVKVDMGKLKTVIDRNDPNDWGGAATQKPVEWWNGVVFVDFPDGAPGPDNVEVPVDGWGVQLHNGGSIPNPSFAQSQGIYGTTVATNNPLYVVGNYNADGNSATGANGAADNANEPPAALAADAITILSTAWGNNDSDESISSRVASSFTEVSAAFLTGLVPSDNGNNNTYSGGVENFPRFLENWSGRTFRYRGSMVALFESEVATQAWGGGDIYSPPTRDWSFDEKFATGKYPPGTPNTRTYRRINFRELNKNEWTAEINAVKSQMGI